MKTYKTIVLVAGVFVALFGLTRNVWSNGTPSGTPACQVDNSSSGAIALRGTATVEVLDSTTLGATDVDLTLRLARGGNVQYFRRTLNISVFDKSNGEVVCDFLDVLSSEILAQFGLSSTRLLKITNKSISNTDGVQEDDLTSPRASMIADITIYAQ